MPVTCSNELVKSSRVHCCVVGCFVNERAFCGSYSVDALLTFAIQL